MGALEVKRTVPGAVTIFVEAPSFEENERRLRARATESEGEIEERLDLAREQLDQADEFDYKLVNDDVDRALVELEEIVKTRALSYHVASMIHPRIDQLLENVNERYALVIVAAKRARQINNYHHQLGEGTFDDNPPPLVESRSKNYLTMALEEIAEGKIKYTYKGWPTGNPWFPVAPPCERGERFRSRRRFTLSPLVSLPPGKPGSARLVAQSPRMPSSWAPRPGSQGERPGAGAPLRRTSRAARSSWSRRTAR